MIGRRGDIIVGAHGARCRGRSLRCSVGRSGITTRKREGDGATPAGVYGLLGILYRSDRLQGAGLAGAAPIMRSDIWSDDPQDPAYNQLVSAARRYRYSHERMRRPDHLYDLVVPTDYNWPNVVAGKGSAIFLHVWKQPRHPTAGCIAFALEDLIWIAERLNRHTRLIVRPG